MMDTLSQTMNELQAKGYTSEIIPDEILLLNADEWQIDEIFRFEGNSNPSDNSILYAITKKDGTRKSLVVNAYGTYSSTQLNDFICHLEKQI